MTPRLLAALSALTATLSAQTWTANLAANPTGDPAYPSSSSLRVTWTAPQSHVDHFQLRAEEKRSIVEARADALEFLLTGLKSATAHTLRLRACLDPACASFLDAAPAAASTPPEYWRVVGTGGSYATAARLVADGNVGSHAFRYGPWAGP